MVSKKATDSIPVFVLWFIYLLSLILLFFNKQVQLNPIKYYEASFFSVNEYVAKVLNLIFLIINFFLIGRVFENKDRHVSGILIAFVYLIFQNNIWLLNHINNYLISDFFILVSLLLINPQEVKRRLDIFVFYLAIVFSIGFLSGINFIYTFIIPILIFNLFLVSVWRTWVIFLLGFILPVYFLITIHWYFDREIALYFQILAERSFYKFSSFSNLSIEPLKEMQWMNVGLLLIIFLAFIAGLREWQDVYFYSTRERRIALLFFFLMFFSWGNYLLIYWVYQQYAPSVIALPYAYYVGKFLNKVPYKAKYFLLFMLLILTSFM